MESTRVSQRKRGGGGSKLQASLSDPFLLRKKSGNRGLKFGGAGVHGDGDATSPSMTNDVLPINGIPVISVQALLASCSPCLLPDSRQPSLFPPCPPPLPFGLAHCTSTSRARHRRKDADGCSCYTLLGILLSASLCAQTLACKTKK